MNDAVLLLALGWGVCASQALERDAARFLPDAEERQRLRAEAYAFKERLKKHAELDPTDATGWRAALGDATWCWACWDALCDVHAWRNHSGLRDKLAHLRRLLGDEAFYTGTMPPSIPVWRLKYRD